MRSRAAGSALLKRRRRIPIWVAVAHTLFVAALIPVYWRQYGPSNFLWFSDIALFATVPALWLGHRLLASMQAIAVLVPETFWIIDFAAHALRGESTIGLAEYMFDPDIPGPVRALSLFHLWLPMLLLWMIARLGYDRRALPLQAVLGSVVLIATYVLTDPQDNINWVFGFGEGSGEPSARHLAVILVGFPLAFYLPAHLLLGRLFGKQNGEE